MLSHENALFLNLPNSSSNGALKNWYRYRANWYDRSQCADIVTWQTDGRTRRDKVIHDKRKRCLACGVTDEKVWWTYSQKTGDSGAIRLENTNNTYKQADDDRSQVASVNLTERIADSVKKTGDAGSTTSKLRRSHNVVVASLSVVAS